MALVLLGTEGCHLCEQAQALLLNLNGKIPCNLYLEDIAESEDMVARYGERIPVLKYEAEEGSSDDLVTCLVMFAWLSNQTYFKELTDQDIRARLVDETERQMEQDMAPFGFVDDGIDSPEDAPFKDAYGTTWSPIKYKRGW